MPLRLETTLVKKALRGEGAADGGVGYRGVLDWKSESGIGPGASLEKTEPSEELVTVRELLDF